MNYKIQQFIHDNKGEPGVLINETNNSLTVSLFMIMMKNVISI